MESVSQRSCWNSLECTHSDALRPLLTSTSASTANATHSRIDLINIRFSDKASDRATAISALQELRQINKARQYNLILIDKNMKDIEAIEKDFLDVIYPKSTHMDFNIAVVLYLATASSGYLFGEKEDATNQDGLRYTTNSKIIISGLGNATRT